MKSSLSSFPLPHVARPMESSVLPVKCVARPKIYVPISETAAALALLLAGGVHGWLLRDAWGDAHYKGILFGIHTLFSLIFAVNLIRGDRFTGWMGGALVCASSALAYIASRTIGLPALPAQPNAWLEPLGVLSMLAEIGFTLVFMCAFVYDDDKEDQL